MLDVCTASQGITYSVYTRYWRTEHNKGSLAKISPLYTHTHTIPPSNIPVSTRPLRITTLTEAERRKECTRTIERGEEEKK